MPRISFSEIFIQHSDHLEFRHKTRVMGIVAYPGVILGNGVSFGGVDFLHYRGSDLEVQIADDLYVITGIYTRDAAAFRRRPWWKKMLHKLLIRLRVLD